MGLGQEDPPVLNPMAFVDFVIDPNAFLIVDGFGLETAIVTFTLVHPVLVVCGQVDRGQSVFVSLISCSVGVLASAIVL